MYQKTPRPSQSVISQRCCVSLSCCKKTSSTGWLINLGHLLLTVLEPGSLRPGCRQGRALVRDLFLAADCPLLLIAPGVKRDKESSLRSLLWEHWSRSRGVHPRDLISSQRPHLLLQQQKNFGGTQTLSP